MMRKSVVFPDPDGPRRAASVPAGASTVTLSRTTFLPNRLEMFLAVMLIRDSGPNGRRGAELHYPPAGAPAGGLSCLHAYPTVNAKGTGHARRRPQPRVPQPRLRLRL